MWEDKEIDEWANWGVVWNVVGIHCKTCSSVVAGMMVDLVAQGLAEWEWCKHTQNTYCVYICLCDDEGEV